MLCVVCCVYSAKPVVLGPEFKDADAAELKTTIGKYMKTELYEYQLYTAAWMIALEDEVVEIDAGRAGEGGAGLVLSNADMKWNAIEEAETKWKETQQQQQQPRRTPSFGRAPSSIPLYRSPSIAADTKDSVPSASSSSSAAAAAAAGASSPAPKPNSTSTSATEFPFSSVLIDHLSGEFRTSDDPRLTKRVLTARGGILADRMSFLPRYCCCWCCCCCAVRAIPNICVRLCCPCLVFLSVLG
jgi:hypothetical protein